MKEIIFHDIVLRQVHEVHMLHVEQVEHVAWPHEAAHLDREKEATANK